jgi:hypothetical protein
MIARVSKLRNHFPETGRAEAVSAELHVDPLDVAEQEKYSKFVLSSVP